MAMCGRTMGTSMKRMRLLLGCIVLVGLSMIIVAGVSASNEWRGTKANVTSGDSQATIRMWERGSDAVLTYETNGAVVQQLRCEGGVLRDIDLANSNIVVHADVSQADCTRMATNPLRGPGTLVKNPAFKASGSTTGPNGHRQTSYVSTDAGGSSVVLDEETGLPLTITSNGKPVTFVYSDIESGTPPPAPVVGDRATTEEYKAVGLGNVASAMGVKSLPSHLAGFTFDFGLHLQLRERKRDRLLRSLEGPSGSRATARAQHDGSKWRHEIPLGGRWPAASVPDLRGRQLPVRLRSRRCDPPGRGRKRAPDGERRSRASDSEPTPGRLQAGTIGTQLQRPGQSDCPGRSLLSIHAAVPR